jgi:hypothetical protein
MHRVPVFDLGNICPHLAPLFPARPSHGHAYASTGMHHDVNAGRDVLIAQEQRMETWRGAALAPTQCLSHPSSCYDGGDDGGNDDDRSKVDHESARAAAAHVST